MRRRVTPSLRVAWLLPTLSAAALFACNKPKLDQDGDGFTELTGDCDDLDANVHPDAQEVCYNGIDDNCNGVEDEEGATSGRTWYVDTDGDGYGQNTVTLDACDQPDGYAAEKWDCRDDDASIHPAADELCDYIDNDCDEEIDETTSVDAMTWYPDGDGDGYGDPERAVTSCISPGEGWLADGGDCKDGDPLVHPGQSESCLTTGDDNCNGVANEPDSFGCIDYFADMDGDGYAGTALCLCEPDAPYTELVGADCDDENAVVFPGAGLEDADWLDLDCDGQITVSADEADVIFGVGDSSLNKVYTVTGGDLDGDGLAEIVIGGRYNGSSSDIRTYLANGASLSNGDQLHEMSDTPLGTYVHGITDLDGDGYQDFIANMACGEFVERPVAVFLGPLQDPDWHTSPDGCIGIEYNPRLSQGARELRLGGHTPEGRATILFPDPERDSSLFGAASAGEVDVIQWDPELGDLSIAGRASGASASQYFGSDAVSAGDVDGDGLDDLLAMNPGRATSDPFGRETSSLSGSVEVYTALDTSPRTTITSNLYYRTTTKELAGPGDFNGDGYADLAFSASDSDIFFSNSGRVHVLFGPFDRGYLEIADLDQQVIVGDATDLYADCVRSIGDFDGDGRTDLLVGAYGWAREETTPGANYVVFGNDETGNRPVSSDSVLLTPTAPRSGTIKSGYCSTQVEHGDQVGDVNGDGLPDLVFRGTRTEESDPEQDDQLFLFFGRER